VRALLAVAVAVAWATAARAADEASLMITGFVPTVCEVEFGDVETLRLDGLDAAQSGTLEARLGVACNVPLIGEIRAERGGLVNDRAPVSLGDGGVAEIEYSLALDFPSLGLVGPFQSDALVAGVSFGSGGRVLFDEEAEMRIVYDTAGPLYAGTYADTVRVTVEPVE
jgi:hypothetical protein